MHDRWIGIDPGKSGAVACIRGYAADGPIVETIKLTETLRDVSDWLDRHVGWGFAYLEQVSAMPKQGVSSTFKFGQSYGRCEALLTALGIPFERVTPPKWQGYLGCRSKGDKNVTKRKAQELFPTVKVTHAIADALLIAEYCRRIREGSDGR